MLPAPSPLTFPLLSRSAPPFSLPPSLPPSLLPSHLQCLNFLGLLPGQGPRLHVLDANAVRHRLGRRPRIARQHPDLGREGGPGGREGGRERGREGGVGVGGEASLTHDIPMRTRLPVEDARLPSLPPSLPTWIPMRCNAATVRAASGRGLSDTASSP
jgi:hypothetical protein